ncbi:MAG TPA: class I SAM-dependent methyltransferase [Candidatus Paceibacterota bacterium]
MNCLLCHTDSSIEFLNLGRQPLANKYPKKEQFAAEDFFPLAALFCTNCKNVQLGTQVPRDRMFEDYYYLSSVNQGLVRHFEQLAHTLSRGKFVVDIGSNDGILLKPLKALGVRCLGVDPSVNVSKIANDAGLPTLVGFFDSAMVKKIHESHGVPDTVVASSVFTHLDDPHQCASDVKKLMKDDGEFIIEVEYIGNILRLIQFERFYLDRIFYYSLTSLSRLFEMHDMYIADVFDIEPHGGSLRVVVRNRGHGSSSERVECLLKEEETSLNIEKLKEFRELVEKNVSALREILEKYKQEGLRVAGYGAPARVSTICNFAHIGPSLIEFLVDDSPLKQNKHSPGTHIPIVPKSHLDAQKPKVDVLVVFAYEYFEDIKKKTGGAYRYLIPIPPREIV